MVESDQNKEVIDNPDVKFALHNLNSKLWTLKFSSKDIDESVIGRALGFADICGGVLIEALKETDLSVLRSEKAINNQNCIFLQDVTQFKSSLMLVAGPYPTKDSCQMSVTSIGLISIPSFVETIQQHPGNWKMLQQIVLLPDPGWLIHWELTELSNQMVSLIKTLSQVSPHAGIFICEIPELGSADYMDKVKKFNAFLQSGNGLPNVLSVDIKSYLPDEYMNNNGSSYLAYPHAEYLIKQLVNAFSMKGFI